MSKPLIILGAGASYDCVQIEKFDSGRQYELKQVRPPLLRNLFDLSRFREKIRRYPEIHKLAADINARIDREGFDLEEYLRRLEKEIAPQNIGRYKQILAFRFFVADLFKDISEEFYEPANNYDVLIAEIEDKGGEACFVNFNYDLLLEKSLGMKMNIVNDYIRNPIKVIKIHGAADWVFEPVLPHFPHGRDAYAFYLEQAGNMLELMKDRRVYQQIKRGRWNFTTAHTNGIEYYLPAVALPVASKESYICPDEHIEVLGGAIRSATSLIIIGWRANDKFLLELLNQETMAMTIPTLVVSSNENNAQEVANKLAPIESLKIEVSSSEGFTGFVKSGEYEKFI